MADAPITFFIPFGNERSNAGLTVRAETVNELAGILSDLNGIDETEESKLSALLNEVLIIKGAVELILPSQAPSQAKPVTHPQAQSAPTDAPTCVHGSMKWKEGSSKSTGKPYKGWFCGAPYGQVQCSPQFVK
jgi:hypothetical protein